MEVTKLYRAARGRESDGATSRRLPAVFSRTSPSASSGAGGVRGLLYLHRPGEIRAAAMPCPCLIPRPYQDVYVARRGCAHRWRPSASLHLTPPFICLYYSVLFGRLHTFWWFYFGDPCACVNPPRRAAVHLSTLRLSALLLRWC